MERVERGEAPDRDTMREMAAALSKWAAMNAHKERRLRQDAKQLRQLAAVVGATDVNF